MGHPTRAKSVIGLVRTTGVHKNERDMSSYKFVINILRNEQPSCPSASSRASGAQTRWIPTLARPNRATLCIQLCEQEGWVGPVELMTGRGAAVVCACLDAASCMIRGSRASSAGVRKISDAPLARASLRLLVHVRYLQADDDSRQTNFRRKC